MNNECAYLGNKNDMISFRYGDSVIRFRGPYSLEYFTAVNEWDNGYIAVMTKYAHNRDPEEDYIDLNPILKDLYIDPQSFLCRIKNVRLENE